MLIPLRARLRNSARLQLKRPGKQGRTRRTGRLGALASSLQQLPDALGNSSADESEWHPNTGPVDADRLKRFQHQNVLKLHHQLKWR